MPSQPHSRPTDSELEILQILWQHGPSTVRSVNDRLSAKRDVGYTTTLKMLQIMTEKNLVVRNEDQRTHVYVANVSEEGTQKRLLDRLLDVAFSGSATKLVMQALGNRKTSKEELDQIRHLLDRMEGDKS